MTDYSSTPLPKKLGIKEGHRVALISPPKDLQSVLDPLPPGVRLLERTKRPVDVILFFVTRAHQLDRRFDRLASALADSGGLWVAWPKKASKLDSDLSFETVQERGLDGGLVDNKSCSIDETWQALRFVCRVKDRPGRTTR